MEREPPAPYRTTLGMVHPSWRSFVFTDKVMACVDCGQEFTFTAGEQEFYAQKGFTEAPKRCSSCRAARKAQRGGSSYSTDSGYGGGGYNSGSYGGGGYSSSGGYSSGGYSGGGYGGERRPRQMYDATCSECGGPAQLPFQPTGTRPVYCSNCFQTRRG